VTNLHTLILPKRHIADFFELHSPERNAVFSLLENQKTEISQRDRSVEGFNVGINVAETAGQTVFHTHIHLIPRRRGDVENPRGGVRGVIPSKQQY
jgi:diadenosine tetraphosphate (Ap4A) HIT family hydrolase